MNLYSSFQIQRQEEALEEDQAEVVNDFVSYSSRHLYKNDPDVADFDRYLSWSSKPCRGEIKPEFVSSEGLRLQVYLVPRVKLSN